MKLSAALGRSGRLLFTCVKYGCVLHCFTEYIAEVMLCTGRSMEPTIFSHDIIVTERLSQLFQTISAGDIVVVRSPTSPRSNICKRVTAVAGEYAGAWGQDLVPRGHIWLEGDNAADSTGSHAFGAVPTGLVRGRVLLRVWPPSQVQVFDARGWRVSHGRDAEGR